MKTTLNRKDIHRFARLAGKLAKQNELPQTAIFSPGEGGMTMTASCRNATLCMTVPGIEIPSSFSLPWPAVKELAAKKSGSVEIEATGKQVTASWLVGERTQFMPYESKVPAKVPVLSMPENSVTHPIRLFDVLGEAGKFTGQHETRSFSSIHLRGVPDHPEISPETPPETLSETRKPQIVVCDGRHIYCHEGFPFPWSGDVLCPNSRIFQSAEIRECGETVCVGAIGKQIYFRVGDVTFRLNQSEGTPLKLDRFLDHQDRPIWLHLDPTDAEFMFSQLDNLPGNTEKDRPVYVLLNGSVTIRGYDPIQKTATELRLSRSRHEGESIEIPMNREFLKNAIGLGVRRIGFGPENDDTAQDGTARNHAANDDIPIGKTDSCVTYFWTTLMGDKPVCDEENLTILDSGTQPASTAPAAPAPTAPAPAETAPAAPVAQPSRKKSGDPNPVKQIPDKTQPVLAKAARRVPAKTEPRIMTPIQAAEAVYAAMRENLQTMRQLVRHMKKQDKQNHALRTRLQLLREELPGILG